MQDEVKVTQADRNAAVRLLELGGQDWQAKEIRLGQGDHFPIVQAFARHRHQAERETLARMEPVAWMYERKGPWPARYFHDKRTPAYLDEGEGWTETPLYTLPAAPEAVRTPIEGTSHAD